MSLLEIQNAAFLPDAIKRFDYNLFGKMNGQWHNSFFDSVLPFLRDPIFWIPFYFFLILFVTINFNKKGWYWVMFILFNFWLSDFVSGVLIKHNFFRLRPCRDPNLAESVRLLLSHCSGGSSFVSSHAANHFAAAMFIFVTFRKQISPYWSLLFIWAFVISYAQVYVGVHFPFDIFCGGIVGCILGYIPAKVFNKTIGLEKLK